jgi:hypothetical protein
MRMVASSAAETIYRSLSHKKSFIPPLCSNSSCCMVSKHSASCNTAFLSAPFSNDKTIHRDIARYSPQESRYFLLGEYLREVIDRVCAESICEGTSIIERTCFCLNQIPIRTLQEKQKQVPFFTKETLFISGASRHLSFTNFRSVSAHGSHNTIR